MVVALLLRPWAVTAHPPEISGGGNFAVNARQTDMDAQYEALQGTGAGAIRMDAYPMDYYDGTKPLPEKSEKRVLEAYRHGVKTVIFLFEYSGGYQKLPGAANQLGDYQKWHDIGAAFATHFAPNSPWLKSQGISDWGISIFSAINEPDNTPKNVAIPITGPSSYYTSLKGLADGVHSVSPTLPVIPGGFAAENSRHDHTLGGYGVALSPLWNDGTLDGIDLHIYNDVLYAPILTKDGTALLDFGPQAGFDAVKKACHITRDVNFYSTEYNFKSETQGIDEPLAATRLLTCIWANLGVVKNDGKTSATQLALAWNVFLTAKENAFDGGIYGMTLQHNPWVPTPRGKTFQLVMSLTKGMNFVSLDPKKTGEYILEGNGRKLWVWQNYARWTDTPGAQHTIADLPNGAAKLEIYGWDGLRKSIPLSGQKSYTVTDLNRNETYMFLVAPVVSK